MEKVTDLYPTVELIKQAVIDGKLDMRWDSDGWDEFVGIYLPDSDKAIYPGLSDESWSKLYNWWAYKGV